MKCPKGHESAATDYCDTCGEAMTLASAEVAAGATKITDASGEGEVEEAQETQEAREAQEAREDGEGVGVGQPCPNCGTPNSPEALFCENCGYDHTTGSMPRREDPAAPPTEANVAPALDPPWVAEIWIDPAWYAAQESPDPLPSPGLPTVVPLRHTSLLIGRVSASRGITPDIDCGADNGVSRRHAQLTTDGRRWWIEDLASSNGTFVADATAPPPERPIGVGTKHEVDADDRIYLGSWTRIVLRPAAEGES